MIMKKTMFILALIFAVYLAGAQDSYQDDEIKTVFSKHRSNGGYGAFSIAYSQIDGHDAFVAGGRGAFIFDHSLAIGLGGYGFVNNLAVHSYQYPNNELSLTGGYGGLFIEPIVAGKLPVHLSFPILFGMGGISQVDLNGWDYWGPVNPIRNYDYDVFFIIEPAVELEFNLARFFRTAAYVSYRYTSNIQIFDTDENVLNGFNFGLTFKFGKF
jgi:hypothetical protein